MSEEEDDMSLSGNFPENGTSVSTEEVEIWREDIPEGNYWIQEGRNYLRTLTKDDVIWMLQRIPKARKDYLEAVNPEREDYVRLANVPLVNHYDPDKMNKGLNRTPQSIEFLWKECKGVWPRHRH